MKSEAACVGTCLYGFSFWVGYSAALGGPLNIRRTRERIDPRLQLPKQFEDLEEVGSPFMMLALEPKCRGHNRRCFATLALQDYRGRRLVWESCPSRSRLFDVSQLR